MCGIAGCVGHENAPAFVVESLETLQYRGYDAAGLAYATDEGLEIARVVGTPTGLRDQVNLEAANHTSSGTALGHTRWATHGEVTIANTHPHTNADGTIASVCNGIIENYEELRQDLMANGYIFTSETDTEVIPHLVDFYEKEGLEPEEAFRKTLTRLSGAYAVLLTTQQDPEALYAARFYSPLVLGMNGSEHIAASSTHVFAGTKQATYLEDEDMARITAADNKPKISHIETARRVTRTPQEIDSSQEEIDKGPYPHFMLKEIHDSADTVRNAMAGRVRAKDHKVKLGGLESVQERLQDVDRFIIVACGTSYYASLIGEQLIEEVAGIPVEVEIASEFNYKNQPLGKNTAMIAVSQSGETADTLGALRKADELGMLKLGVVNSLGSSIYRQTDAGVYCHAGPEIAVASTKAFISQVTVLAEVAMVLANKSNDLSKPLIEELATLPGKIESMLADTSAIQEAASKYADYEDFLFIGRGYNYPVAMEGALKLKEVSYIHAEGYGAGEMKHGPLAMIEPSFPTVAIATNSATLEKTLSNIEEIRSRKGHVLALATEGNETIKDKVDDVLYVPASLEQTQPILNAIVLQLFAYYVAKEKGLNIDQPRNLAKSSTVE